MILIIDNYDSFVHNLARYVREEGHDAVVIRNDAQALSAVMELPYRGVIISPGPKRPADAGFSVGVIKALSPATPLLGVCLGHQCLVEAFDGKTRRAAEPMHGEASEILHDGLGVFEGIENPMLAGRYHSLICDLDPGGALAPCAWSRRGELMAARHRSRPWHGVQFHPESLLTPSGKRLIRNFLNELSKGPHA